MKKFYYSLLCLIFTTQIVTAQWYMQQSGTTKNLRSAYFVDQNTGWVCGTNGTIIKTSNGGLDWIAQNSNTADNLKSIQFVDQNKGWAFGDTSFLGTQNGGTTWNVSSSSSQIVGFKFFLSGPGLIGWIVYQTGFFTLEIYKYVGGWVYQGSVPAGDGDALFFLDENNGWITDAGWGDILRTTDGGSNWDSHSANILGTPTCIQFTTPLIGWVNSNSLGNYDISKSTDGGVTWFSQNTGGLNEFINSIAFPNSVTGYAVGFQTYTPPIHDEAFIIKTGNGGTYWEEQYRDNGKLNSVFFVNENLGWAVGDSGKILVTANGGIPVEFSLFTAYVLQNEKVIQLNWATATETNNSGFEILRKDQNSSEWNTIGFVPGFGTTTEPKSYSFIDEDVTTGTYKYRLKQIDFDGTFTYSNEIEIEVDFTPKEFALLQNYPNPFNPSTSIKYQIPDQARNDKVLIVLKVYDILGNEVATLINEEKQSGIYKVEFLANGLTSGIYFYRLQVYPANGGAGSFVETKKMVLMK